MNIALTNVETSDHCHYLRYGPAIAFHSLTLQRSNSVHSVLLAVWRGLAQTSERIERTAGGHRSTTGLWQDKSAHIARRSLCWFAMTCGSFRQCIGNRHNVLTDCKSLTQLILEHIMEIGDG
ncbi:hypothetical protein [Methylovirgula sp. HY1]|uniref:hypothetical protein n=1 Tax=Methylovirgula sp. HY1 TaxID=2822761 RepID=UPI001C5BDA7C|nr:hypothetical protein [Methylovirgula sp. HY1]QXX76138.1 hypothetical protein MHY1_02973 [Methylovirgula sp. HY1]